MSERMMSDYSKGNKDLHLILWPSDPSCNLEVFTSCAATCHETLAPCLPARRCLPDNHRRGRRVTSDLLEHAIFDPWPALPLFLSCDTRPEMSATRWPSWESSSVVSKHLQNRRSAFREGSNMISLFFGGFWPPPFSHFLTLGPTPPSQGVRSLVLCDKIDILFRE